MSRLELSEEVTSRMRTLVMITGMSLFLAVTVAALSDGGTTDSVAAPAILPATPTATPTTAASPAARLLVYLPPTPDPTTPTPTATAVPAISWTGQSTVVEGLDGTDGSDEDEAVVDAGDAGQPELEPTDGVEPIGGSAAVPTEAEPAGVPVDVAGETEAVEVAAEPEVIKEPVEGATIEAPAEEEPEADTSDGSPWDDALYTLDGGVMGVILSPTANVRSAPSIDAAVVDELYARYLVTIYDEIQGDLAEGTDIWYLIGPEQYISAALVAPFIPPAPVASYEGHWVDVNMTEHYAVAYDGDIPVYAAIIIAGRPDFETPVGEFTIFERVENETLDSATVGIPEGDPEYYYLPDVRYTQYFADNGFALHSNYWSDPWEFGTAGSHGCINLMENDAAWFWEFLTIGSVVSIHY